MELGAEFGGKLPEPAAECSLAGGGDAEEDLGFARDGIAQVAAVEAAQAQGEALPTLPEQAGGRLVRIDSSLVDVVARVSALQVGDADAEEAVVGRGRNGRIAERGQRVDAAGAADEQLALVLGVEVDQVGAREHSLAQSESTREAGLLIDREERLEGSVLDRRVEQRGQRGGHADAAVGAERRALGLDPLPVDAGTDGVVLEVELHVGVLLADHVHVRLEDDRRTVLEARGGGFAHDDVARRILAVFDAVALGERHQEVDDPALLLRGARNLRDGIELFPDDARFERGDG